MIEQNKDRFITRNNELRILWIAVFVLVGIIVCIKTQPQIISPLGESPVCLTYQAPKTIDYLIDYYSNKYGKSPWDKLTTKVKLHFLLLRESVYGTNKNCGDSGLSCGPMQFRASTYANYRAKMLKLGLVTDMGSLWDLENSIDTAAYIISVGGQNNWGPILRQEIKL